MGECYAEWCGGSTDELEKQELINLWGKIKSLKSELNGIYWKQGICATTPMPYVIQSCISLYRGDIERLKAQINNIESQLDDIITCTEGRNCEGTVESGLIRIQFSCHEVVDLIVQADEPVGIVVSEIQKDKDTHQLVLNDTAHGGVFSWILANTKTYYAERNYLATIACLDGKKQCIRYQIQAHVDRKENAYGGIWIFDESNGMPKSMLRRGYSFKQYYANWYVSKEELPLISKFLIKVIGKMVGSEKDGLSKLGEDLFTVGNIVSIAATIATALMKASAAVSIGVGVVITCFCAMGSEDPYKRIRKITELDDRIDKIAGRLSDGSYEAGVKITLGVAHLHEGDQLIGEEHDRCVPDFLVEKWNGDAMTGFEGCMGVWYLNPTAITDSERFNEISKALGLGELEP